jgi:hypothetical protein
VGILQQVYEPFGQRSFQPRCCLPGKEWPPDFEGDPRAEELCCLPISARQEATGGGVHLVQRLRCFQS